MQKVRLGVIGVGTMGRVHLGKLHEIRNVELTAVCDIDGARAKEAATQYKCAAYADHRELLKDRVCDAILIVTPHYAHTSIGIDALHAGLHVLVEKPISVHKADCQRLIAAHTKRRQVFAAMFNQRTDPRYRKLRQLVQDGTLGKLDRITWIITDWFRNEESVSAFLKTTPDLWARPDVWNVEIPTSGFGGQHVEILQNFINSIVEKAPLIAPAAEGIHSVELGNAMLYSSETGKTVELPLNGKAYERMLKHKIKTSRFVKKTKAVKPGDISRSY